jgi:hypothetical protein
MRVVAHQTFWAASGEGALINLSRQQGHLLALICSLHATNLLLQDGATFSDAAATRSSQHVDRRMTLESRAAATADQQDDAAAEGLVGRSENEQSVANELTIIMAVKQRGGKDGGERGLANAAVSSILSRAQDVQ